MYNKGAISKVESERGFLVLLNREAFITPFYGKRDIIGGAGGGLTTSAWIVDVKAVIVDVLQIWYTNKHTL